MERFISVDMRHVDIAGGNTIPSEGQVPFGNPAHVRYLPVPVPNRYLPIDVYGVRGQSTEGSAFVHLDLKKLLLPVFSFYFCLLLKLP